MCFQNTLLLKTQIKQLMESASSDFKRTYRFFIKLICFGTRLIKILDLNWYVALYLDRCRTRSAFDTRSDLGQINMPHELVSNRYTGLWCFTKYKLDSLVDLEIYFALKRNLSILEVSLPDLS